MKTNSFEMTPQLLYFLKEIKAKTKSQIQQRKLKKQFQ